MKINREVRFLGSRDCKYTMRGRKLIELRRAELRPLARALRVAEDSSLPKNELLHRVISKLDAIGADTEIGSVGA